MVPQNVVEAGDTEVPEKSHGFLGTNLCKISGGCVISGAFWDACQCTQNEWKSEEGKLEFEVSFVEFHWKFARDNMTEKLGFLSHF